MWNKASNPPVTDKSSAITDVLESSVVLIQVKNYYALGKYTRHTTDPNTDKSQGHWRINGHTGKWDKFVQGWSAVPALVEYTK